MYNDLTNSYIWSNFNKSGALNSKISTFLEDGVVIDPVKRMPIFFFQLKNKIKSPLANKYIDAILSGDIKLIFNNGVRIPVYLPFFTIKVSPNKCVGIVPINNLVKNVDDDGISEIVTDKETALKDAIESCYIACQIFNMGNNRRLTSTTIIRRGSLIYANMLVTSIDRKHQIKLVDNIYNSVIYMTSKFFIGTVLGLIKNEYNINEIESNSLHSEFENLMENYCLYNCRDADVYFIRKVNEQFLLSDYENIATFIKKLSLIPQLQVRLKNLNVSGFLDAFIRLYDSSMILSLESFQYFMYNVISVIDQTYTNNYAVLRNIIGDEGKVLYNEVVSAVQ